MNKTRVFQIISHFDVGGAERIATNIAASKNDGFDYYLIEVVRGCSSFTPAFLEEIRDKGIKYYQSPISNTKFAILLFPFWFVILFLKKRPNIIHTHTEIPDLSIYLFYKMFSIFTWNVKFVRTIHNTVLWDKWVWIGKHVEKFYQWQHANIAISHSTLYSYEKVYRKSAPIIYNGVEVKKQKFFYNIKKGKTNILFAGRLEEQKGINTLIALLQRLKNHPKLFFHIVGNGSMEQIIRQSFSGFNNIVLYNSIPNLSCFLSSFDYLLMPSNHEGLGLLSIEASNVGLPAIINDCPGLNETLPLNWPLKVRNNSIEEYLTIFHNIETFDREELKKEAFNYIQRFSIAKMQHQYEELYKS